MVIQYQPTPLCCYWPMSFIGIPTIFPIPNIFNLNASLRKVVVAGILMLMSHLAQDLVIALVMITNLKLNLACFIIQPQFILQIMKSTRTKICIDGSESDLVQHISKFPRASTGQTWRTYHLEWSDPAPTRRNTSSVNTKNSIKFSLFQCFVIFWLRNKQQ